MKKKPRVLLVEDDESLREILAMNLEDSGFIVEMATDGERALELYDPLKHEVVLTDLKMPGVDGFQVLEGVHAVDPGAVVLVLTAFGGSSHALEAMRRGAFHYVEKPVNTRALVQELERALEHRASLAGSSSARGRDVGGAASPRSMIAASPAMNRVLRIVDKVANSDAPVMILGESGVGKELVARTIHERSGRKDAPFVAVNCAAIPGDLLESILFGYEKGAFTGAQQRTDGKFLAADGGTLFLDEIAEMSHALQSKMLRVLQDQLVERVGSVVPEHVDVRILAATHQDLEARIAQGSFRQDLYYRLNVIPIEVAPLRARKEDIPVLARHFLRELGGDQLDVTREVDEVFLAYAWPGNIRELRNIIERMVLLRDHDILTLEDVPAALQKGLRDVESPTSLPFELPEGGLDLIQHEKQIIIAALEKMGGNQSATARYLNIPRHVLVYRFEKYAIDPLEYASG